MIMDKMEFSDAQAITASTATDSTNVLDLGLASTGSDVGSGTPIWVVGRVNTTFVDAAPSAANTWRVALQHSASEGSGFVDVFAGPAANKVSSIAANNDMTKGADLLTQPLPTDLLRYLKVQITPAAASGPSAGKIDAFLTLNAPLNT